MECSEAKKLSLLDAGGDLYVDEQAALRQHLRHCDACNSYAAGMVPVMSVLSSLRDTPVTWQPISVWPAVGASIRLRSASVAPVRRFNLQVAALAVCSLSLAAVVIVQTLSTMRLADDRPQPQPQEQLLEKLFLEKRILRPTHLLLKILKRWLMVWPSNQN